MTLTQEFTDLFRAEHREVRDLLLALVDAFQLGDAPRARSLVGEIAAAAGPHFRYEEEAMYPQLVDIFGASYVSKLFSDHDGAIRNARELLELVRRDAFTADQIERGVELTRQILPHVSDCDGLSIMVETLPDQQVVEILQTRLDALRADLDLLTWAATTRERRA